MSSRRKNRLVYWFIITTALLVGLLAGFGVASLKATREQNSARHFWGEAKLGIITGSSSIGEEPLVMNYTISYTGRDGKPKKASRLLRGDRHLGTHVLLWESRTGVVLVKHTRYQNPGGFRPFNKTWMTSPWPTTQGTYLGYIGLTVGVALAIALGLIGALAFVNHLGDRRARKSNIRFEPDQAESEVQFDDANDEDDAETEPATPVQVRS